MLIEIKIRNVTLRNEQINAREPSKMFFDIGTLPIEAKNMIFSST